MPEPTATGTALEQRARRLLPLSTEQLQHVERVTARNNAIQLAGPKPVDGITFGKKGGKADGGE